jgi:U3 small nucleolar RNA-associated protein 7
MILMLGSLSTGQVTLWSPSMSTPHVKLLAHMGPIQSIAVDPSSSSCGRYMATSGADGTVKVWDCRNWGQTVREWTEKSHGVHELDWSMKGMLAVSGKGAVNVYTDCQTSSDRAPKLYMKLDLPGRTPRSIRFCPFEDILGVGHDAGFSSLIVPGSGLAQFDSNEADVFESKTRKREKEVRGVLEKIRPDLITMDADFLGKMGAPKKEAYSERETPFYKKTRVERLQILGKSGEDVDSPIEAEVKSEDESGDERQGVGKKLKVEQIKHKMRGRDKGVKKFLRKKRKNVMDPAYVSRLLPCLFIWYSADFDRRINSGGGQGKGRETKGKGRSREEDRFGGNQGGDRCFGSIRLSGDRTGFR